MSVEKELRGVSGWGMVVALVVLAIVSVAGFISGIRDSSPVTALGWSRQSPGRPSRPARPVS